MNRVMNIADDANMLPGYRIYRRLSDMNALAPSQVLLFLEEHPDSIDDPVFLHRPALTTWTDVPGALHDGASWTTFADGHVESRQWTSPTVRSPVRFILHWGTGAAEQADLQWLTAHVGEKP
jgi:prepilin-type processing-associated H-X9-DG protein